MWANQLSVFERIKMVIVWIGGTALAYFLASWLVDALIAQSPFFVKVLLMLLVAVIIYASDQNMSLKRRLEELERERAERHQANG